MRFLVIADYYDRDVEEPLADVVDAGQIDAVITAGDLSAWPLSGIEELSVPTMGVYGNHCNGTYLEQLGITNLHLTRVVHQNISFVGLQGCVRYKEDPRDILYTQQEYRTLVESLPPADVLVTHCPPRGVNDHDDPAHVGIDALLPWLDHSQPGLLIHGHTYPDDPVTAYRQTRIEYVRGARIIDFPTPGVTSR